MAQQPEGVDLLRSMEEETLEEGREWTRRRFEEKLRLLEEERGAISPPHPTPAGQRKDETSQP